jgi:hypothetical protein
LGEKRSLQSSKEVSDKFSYKLDIEKTTALQLVQVNDTGFEIGIEQKASGCKSSVEDV